MIPKKICIIGPFPPIKGGISQYDEFLANELKKKSEIYCFSYKRQYPKFLIKNREQIDAKHKTPSQADFCIDSINPLTWITTLNKVRKLKPDLVILPWWVVYWVPMYLFFLSSFRFMKIKSLLICHNIYEHEDNVLKKLLSKLVLRMASMFLVHTESEKLKLKNIVGGKTIIKHLHPIYSYANNNVHNNKSAEKEKYNLKLLFFGFVRSYKGLDLLLEALQTVDKTKVHLTIAGEFWNNKNQYLKFIESHGLSNIDIVDGYISDDMVDVFFKQCDVVVLPYRDATGSGIIASAYGYLKPVLVTNVGGLPDAVLHEQTGYIVEKESAEIASGIEWFSNNNHLDFKTNINAFVIENMSWSCLVKSIYEGMKS